jgi:hypothetical protein
VHVAQAAAGKKRRIHDADKPTEARSVESGYEKALPDLGRERAPSEVGEGSELRGSEGKPDPVQRDSLSTAPISSTAKSPFPA